MCLFTVPLLQDLRKLLPLPGLKGGLKTLAGFFTNPLKKRFDAANGDGSWSRYLANYAGAVENRRSEILFLREDLSFKENIIDIRVKRGFAMMNS